jgi:hypothetical protein
MTGDEERAESADVDGSEEESDATDGDAEAGWSFGDGHDASEAPDVDDDRQAGGEASSASTDEPLGGLRDRVRGEDDDAAPPTLFPEDSPASGASAGAERDAPPVDDDAGGEDRDGPLGDLAAGIDGRRERKSKADEALFDEVDVGELDADELWAQVETDEPTVEPRGEREIREVQKRKYCSQCPHFADPPDVGCGHEGTDILEQVDMEHFKVADCPVVLEDERLEDVTTE